MSSYEGALALVSLPVRKNWRNTKLNDRFYITGCSCSWSSLNIQTLNLKMCTLLFAVFDNNPSNI